MEKYQPDEMVLATRIARRYFLDNRSKLEIAEEFAISRFKVARLLDVARDSGIVTITITGPGALDTERSDAVRRRFGLEHAIVVSTSPGDDARIRRQLGQVAAELGLPPGASRAVGLEIVADRLEEAYSDTACVVLDGVSPDCDCYPHLRRPPAGGEASSDWKSVGDVAYLDDEGGRKIPVDASPQL